MAFCIYVCFLLCYIVQVLTKAEGENHMTSAQIIIVVTIVLYLAAMVLVGVYFGKKGSGSSSDDFYLGGRKMAPSSRP